MSAWGASPADELRTEQRRARSRRLVRRSTLFVPSNVPKYVEKAYTRGADAIVLDLEDSIPPNEKTAARVAARSAYPVVARGGADVLVRINKSFELAVLDLDAVVAPGLDAIFFPKLESARELAILNALLFERELAAGLEPGSIEVMVAVENARGVFNFSEIVAECERVERVYGISYGAEDATEELGVETTPEGWERFYGNAMAVQAAAAAGIQPFGRLGSVFDITNLEEYEDSIRRSALFGFKGSACIHPAHVPILNKYFSPPPEQIDRARRTIAAMQEAIAGGRASATVDGKMVDIPTQRRAERILERAQAIEEKEARKRAALAPA